jgi:hypothetical protein
LENGIEDLETILELNDTHLESLGVPLGYKLKILKRIKTIRQEKGMTLPESRQRPDSAMSTVSAASIADSVHSLTQPKKSALKQPKKEVKAVEKKDSNELIEGEFDEAESHNSFLKALNAWRGVKDEPETKEKGVKFADNKKPGSFFANIQKDQGWNVVSLP